MVRLLWHSTATGNFKRSLELAEHTRQLCQQAADRDVDQLQSSSAAAHAQQ